MRVLIIDDDPDIGEFLERHLPAHGFTIDLAKTGMQGLEMAHVNQYDLLVLDLNLPDMTGERVCEEIRRSGRSMPILMLSVILDTGSKARLLNAGVDDYLGKPFSFDELLARVRALLRRPNVLVPEALHAGDLMLDAHTQTARRGRRDLQLTRKEFGLLEYLLRHRGSVVSKTELIEHVWDSKAEPLSAAIETHMTNLRRKVGDPSVIHTVHGRGYRVIDRV
ncbi:MAG TPA: response regulator transcription factor [Candidatus Paceibacterota bacterium]|nr:response regulator transcription factor [Candidatus Paceibacterota bacterium]